MGKMDKARVLHRLKIIRGHLDFVIDMVNHNKDCFEILNQSKAVAGGLRMLNIYMLEQYLRNCVFKNKTNEEQQAALKEVIELFMNRKSLPVS